MFISKLLHTLQSILKYTWNFDAIWLLRYSSLSSRFSLHQQNQDFESNLLKMKIFFTWNFKLSYRPVLFIYFFELESFE